MGSPTFLDGDVRALAGVAGQAADALARLGITTVRDLLEHYPHQGRYRDVGAFVPAGVAPVGEAVTLVGHIRGWNVIRPRGKRLTIAKARFADDDGTMVEVAFFNQPWRPGRHPAGSRVAVSGTLEQFRDRLQLSNPRLTEVEGAHGDGHADLLEDVDRVVPTYPATERLPSARIGALIAGVLQDLPSLVDHLPAELRERHGLVDLDTALRRIHRPADLDDVEPARQRLVYDELLCLQIGLQQRRQRLESEAAGLLHPSAAAGLATRFLASLPFEPTAAQQDAVAGIAGDLESAKPMHRLLQGDVGSGKTLVAAWAMLTALDNGRQAVLMAPTEVLSEQHHRTFQRLFAPMGVNVLDGPRVELLTGSMPTNRRRGVLAELAAGDIGLLIGTHAVLEEVVRFSNLGVVVVDEQHRFGVEHRARLRDKRYDGNAPDVLVMTATPIPRSLALTVYGDLDVTVLDELPPGRQEIATRVIESGSRRRERLYEFVRERVALGERAYVVCPLVEDSEALQAKSAESMHAHLSTEVFPDLSIGLVHGRLPAQDKDAAMEAFRTGEVQVLVATTVIEVGVDVPEATIMIIEDAERFGMSQLHQLRGRVGRGSARSYCVLFTGDPDDNARLEALASTTDGFKLAEVDLEVRGEGSLFDTRQSGLPDLRLASLVRDAAVVSATRDDARRLVARDPELESHPLLRGEVARRYGEERLEALRTG